MKTIITIGFGFLISAAPAQERGSVSGRVLDAESLKPLMNANILIHGTTMGTSTGKDGEFALHQVRPGEQTIIATYVGYERFERRIAVSDQQTIEMVIRLAPTVLPGQTIVVTATRGRERETPATFSTLQAKELAARYSTQDIPQLLSELPSTTFYSENGNGIGYNYLNIRGFDQRRISVMINGVPQNDPEDHNVYWLDFPDLAASLQDAQVQRGAGSAFYGPAAIGGSVNLITSNFGSSPAITLFSGYGSFNTRKFSVSAHSGLIGDQYAVQARLSKITSDGYRERSWTDFSSYFLSAVRFDETMTTQLNFYGGPIADHLAYYGIPKEDAYSPDESRRRANPIQRPEEIENFSQPHYEFLHEWRINDRLTLNNTLFLVTGEGFFDYDGSWAPYSYYRITPQNGFNVPGDPDTLFIPNALIRAWVGNVQYGWLPRVTLKHDGGELTIGMEARVHRSLHWGSLRWGEQLPAGVTPEYRYYEYRGAKDIFSAYAHEVYRLRPDLTLLFDIQYAYNKYRLFDEKYVGTDFSVPYHFLNPRFGLNYNLDDRWNMYVQVSRTSREPRLKNLYDAAESSTPASWGAVVPQFEERITGGYDFLKPMVKPESLTDLEVGGGFSMDAFKATANVFLMEFTNEIIKSGRLDRFGQPVTGNAERTRHLGVEVTATARMGAVEVHGNMTISRNRLTRYTVYDAGVPFSLDGNAIAGFPDVLGNVRLSYASHGFNAAVSVQHVGSFYTDNFQDPDGGKTEPDRTVDAYTVAYAWLGYRIPSVPFAQGIEARLQVNNLLNTIYASHGEGGDFFPAATRNVFASLRVTL
ncbi:MAG: TonB-dependent receptor [Ignavibacteriales bacterium]|nr:TonB-dependent receptor [Ignavibacteriales bacterium]